MTRADAMDWSGCPGVERVADRQGGAPVFRGTRVPVAAILDNYDGGSTVAEIVENFDVTPEQVEMVIAYVRGPGGEAGSPLRLAEFG